MTGTHIVVCAGETSGDNLAAGMMRSNWRAEPDLRFTGMGGEAMRAAGAETLIDVSELAVMGLWE
jgi:lipid-A-disaccharide synthase